MKNLPMDVLRAFVTVVEVGGFTQAGELLGRSQPAISLQIKRLEGLTGKVLLHRVGAQVELTDAGRHLLEYAKNILSLNDEAMAEFHEDHMAGTIKLGIPSEFALTLLPKIVSRFSHTYPNVTLEVVSDLSKNLTEGLKKKRFDLILALHNEPDEARSELIKVDDLVWVGRHDSSPTGRTSLPLIAAPEGCIYRQRAITRLDQQAIPWRMVFTMPDLSGIQSVVNEGLGLTVLAKSTVPKGLKLLKVSEYLPELGSIGISIDLLEGQASEAVGRLTEYLKAGLSH